MYLQVLSRLRHDDNCYAKGDMVEMDATSAAVLIADGIVEKSNAKAWQAWQASKATDTEESDTEASSEDTGADSKGAE